LQLIKTSSNKIINSVTVKFILRFLMKLSASIFKSNSSKKNP